MKSTELRLGNYIWWLHEESESVNVVNLEILEKLVYNEEDPSDSQDRFARFGFRYAPIPLTEQWLDKFGFFPHAYFTVRNSWMYNLGRNRQITIGSVGSPNCMVFLQEIGRDSDGNERIDDLICLHNFDYDGKLYVHDLQNIVFAISRQELTITD